MTTARSAPQSHGAGRFLRWIAAFKFIEALTMLATGLAAHKLLQPQVLPLLQDWADDLPVGHTEQFVAQKVLGWLANVAPGRIKAAGIAAFLLAGVFLLEGVGLWMRKLWAEWLTVVATSLFIPVELHEIATRPSLARFAVLVVNLLVVAYLVRQVLVKEEMH
jgi:uncharacterized membrane protein (DUF2068 family)